MKKLISVCILLSVLFVLLTGCQSRGPEQDLGDTYVPESDNQYYFYLSGIQGYPMAESEDAYYFLQDQYLYSRNKKTGKCVPLCNKPDCTHDEQFKNSDGSSNCNAFFGAIRNIAYYQEKLYILSLDPIMYEMDIGGSTRKELLHLKEPISCAMVHRGYLYLSFTDFLSSPEEYSEEEIKDMGYRVERYRLDRWDGKPEVIYEKKGEYGQINTLFAYGNRIYIHTNTGTVTTYNVVDHSISAIPEINGYLAALHQKLVYFKNPKGFTGEESLTELFEMRKKNMAVMAGLDGNIEKETEIPQIYSRIYGYGNRIAADNSSNIYDGGLSEEDRGVRFYDQDGKFIREIKTGNGRMPSLGMDEDYFFYVKSSENGEGTELWAIDLHRLDDSNLEGEPFFVPEA